MWDCAIELMRAGTPIGWCAVYPSWFWGCRQQLLASPFTCTQPKTDLTITQGRGPGHSKSSPGVPNQLFLPWYRWLGRCLCRLFTRFPPLHTRRLVQTHFIVLSSNLTFIGKLHLCVSAVGTRWVALLCRQLYHPSTNLLRGFRWWSCRLRLFRLAR